MSERIDEITPKKIKVLQPEGGFRFGTDAILLSYFAGAKKRERVADLGCGTGIIGLLIAAYTGARVTGLELQPEMAEMAARSAALNGLGNMTVLQGDLRQAEKLLGWNAFDRVVSNPPYERVDAGPGSENTALDIARREICCTLEDVTAAAYRLLRNGGSLSLVYPARYADRLFSALFDAKFRLKRAQLVCDSAGKPPVLLLAEGRRGGGPGVEWLPPLILKDENGYTPQARRYYYEA